MKFKDRSDAGEQLAQKLISYKNNAGVLVLGLPRGGVIVAKEIADALNVPLDVLVARKIGAPSNPELAVGALTAGGTIYINKPLIESMGVTMDDLAPIIEAEKKEADRREKKYRDSKKNVELKDKIVILVDDGIATGATMRVAIMALKNMGVQKIVVAVPVMPIESIHALKNSVSELVCLYGAQAFFGVGQFYDNFEQVNDEEVIKALG